MDLQGKTLSRLGEVIEVVISTPTGTETLTVGEGGLFFVPDGISIESGINDTFDHLCRSEARITLESDRYLPGLYCNGPLDGIVNIYRGEQCMFAGYISPMAYNQNFNDATEDVEVDCLDALAVMDSLPYRATDPSEASFADILRSAVGQVTSGIDLKGGHAVRLLFDGSRRISATASPLSLLESAKISEVLFVGQKESDEAWSMTEVVEEILRYLNLRLIQEGFDFYIYALDSVKAGATITWIDLMTGAPAGSYSPKVIESTVDIVNDTDAQLTMLETYNRITVECDVEEIDEVISDPLDSSAVTSPYSNRELWAREIEVKDASSTGYSAMEWSETDWYLRVMTHPRWIFPDPTTHEDMIAKYCSEGEYQYQIPKIMGGNIAAALLSMGSVKKDFPTTDASPDLPSMTDALVISVNGNGDDTLTSNTYPTPAALMAAAPVAYFDGDAIGNALTPPDTKTINYILFTGQILLVPVTPISTDYTTMKEKCGSPMGMLGVDEVPAKDNKTRYYSRQYYWQQSPNSNFPLPDNTIPAPIAPFGDNAPTYYKFAQSAGTGAWLNTDNVDKVAVVACMLIVGDKCLVESDFSGEASVYSYTWKAYKHREQCASDDEYFAQCFYLGFDPKLNSWIIGETHDIQNNVTPELGIDEKGMAIPIRHADALSGKIRFEILGPVNAIWEDAHRRHSTWFRSASVSTTARPILPKVSSIQLRSLEVKLVSDNGKVDLLGNSADLIYTSDVDETFDNKRDVTFKISSGLTAEERAELGVDNTLALSTPSINGHPLLEIYDATRGLTAKPEQLYVDRFYREWHAPRRLLEQNVDDEGVNIFDQWIHPALDGNFFVQSLDRNLTEGSARLTIKDC